MPVPLEFHVRANASQYKAEMAQVKAIAMGMNGVGGGMGGHGGHGGLGLSSGGGTSGMMRESLVILREIGRGNWARVPGSITLLIQYMGGLSKILKVTHSDLAQHALALEKEAQAMAKAALAEAVKNGTSKLQLEATKAKAAAAAAQTVFLEKEAVANQAAAAAEVNAAELQVAAGQAKVQASNLAVIAKQREAAAYAEAAQIEGAATTVSLGPIGWLAAAVVALGVAAYFVLNRMAKIAQLQENLAEATGHVNDQAERQTKRMHDQADAARKLAEEIANVHRHQKTLAEISDEATESLRRNAQAKADVTKADKQLKLDEIDLLEKMHKISAQEATRRRANVEIEAAKTEQQNKVDALALEKMRRRRDLEDAEEADAAATKAYEAAAKKSGAAGPQGTAATNRLADLTRQEEFLSKYSDALNKRELNIGDWKTSTLGKGMVAASMGLQSITGTKTVTVDGKEMPVADQKDIDAQLARARAARATAQKGMTDAEVATAQAKARMDEAAASRLRLQVESDKAGIALADQQKNGAALTAKQIEDINLKQSTALYEEGQRGMTQAFGLNSQQKAGAYATLPPDFKRLVEAAVRTANNTEPKPAGFNPVGNTPAKFGPGHR